MSIDLFSENKQTLQIHKRGVLILFLSDKRHFAFYRNAFGIKKLTFPYN